jgi:hypothetical protein
MEAPPEINHINSGDDWEGKIGEKRALVVPLPEIDFL